MLQAARWTADLASSTLRTFVPCRASRVVMGNPIFVEPEPPKPSADTECAWQSFARRLRLPSQSAGSQTEAASNVDALLEALCMSQPCLLPPAPVLHRHMQLCRRYGVQCVPCGCLHSKHTHQHAEGMPVRHLSTLFQEEMPAQCMTPGLQTAGDPRAPVPPTPAQGA